MKVLVVAPSLQTRGGITSVVKLHMKTRAWKEMQCMHLATHYDRSGAGKLFAAGLAYLKAPLMVAAADIVHIHMAGEISLLRKLPIAAIARILRKPYIAHIHASGPESLFDKTPRWATRFILAHASRTIALSESWAAAIRLHIPEARVEVIPNPVRTFAAKGPAEGHTVLFAGKLEARKGYKTLLEAVPAILMKFPDAQFVLAGHGETLEASQIAAQLGISGSVQIVGWASESEMDQLFGTATVFCLPSRNEGVPMSVLEAMSRGVPVVCTPVGGIPEVIADGRNGLLVPVDDAASLSAAIMRLFNDPEYAKVIGGRGRETVSAWCSLEQIDEQLSGLYNSIGPRGAVSTTIVENAL